jgi:transposase
MEEIKLNERDQQRLRALLELDAGRLELEDVASELEKTPRQIRRVVKRFKLEGPAAVVHGNRGRAPGITKPAALREQVIHLYKTKYVDFNFCQFTQMLEEREGIFLSVSTVRKWLLAEGLKPPRQQRRPRKRSRRQRYPRIGMLIQMDASTEDWLEGRGPKLCLFLAIDDASS